MGKRRGKRIAVDFDGVIHDYNNSFQDGDYYGFPIEGAFESIWLLHKRGLHPFIFTTRADKEVHIYKMREWFNIWIPMVWKRGDFRDAEDQEEVLRFFKEIEITNIKFGAIAYIDDRAIRFTNWDDMRKYFC